MTSQINYSGQQIFNQSVPMNTQAIPMNTQSLPINTQSVPMNTQAIPMNIQSIPMNTQAISDNLNLLPTDKNIPNKDSIHMANMIFGEQKSISDKIINEGKDMFLVGLLFIIFSLPQIDEMIKKFINVANNSEYILVAIKAIAVMILYWLIKNYYLSRQ
jgi:hypothetical protein